MSDAVIPAEENEQLAVDDFDDGDSAISAPNTSSLTSLRSSVLRVQEENGRTYHSMSSGKYNYPNDETENERLDIQHYVWLLTLQGALGLSPKMSTGAKRVLDAGTGTGIWAVEYADLHPDSEVIGIDLSPIQPSLVPPNCSFEVDDLEKDWTWSKPFELILARVMTGCFVDMQEFINKAYANLEPGGYLEMQDLTNPLACDDGTLTKDLELCQLGHLLVEASAKAGRPNNTASQYKTYLEKAGFVDVVEHRYKWPLNQWPKDKRYKDIGAWTCENLTRGLEGLLLALLTRFLGWTPEEVRVFCTLVRKQLRDTSIHGYIPVYVVYGKKPEADEASPTPVGE